MHYHDVPSLHSNLFIAEFIDVAKPQQALDVLYDVIKSKRHRTWQKIHEPIMQLYLELCVDLKKSHVAKEGLYQYKNICQQVWHWNEIIIVLVFILICVAVNAKDCCSVLKIGKYLVFLKSII